MKLVVQIPCLNEEKTLPLVIESIPRTIPGIDQIDILVIDDGSSDKTVAVAKKLGVKYFVRHRQNMGLAKSFSDGVLKALEMGADIVVNTDGDNQYPQKDIAKLVGPILSGKADIVIADRQTSQIKEFSGLKKLLQKFGSKVVNLAAGTNIPDAASGFRAYSRESLIMLNTITRFSYCMETIIQAGYLRLRVEEIPVEFRKRGDESRLISSVWSYAKRSAYTLLFGYLSYRPLKVFLTLGGLLFAAGFFVGAGVFLHFLRSGLVSQYIPSAILSAVLLLFGFQIIAIGLVAEMIKNNRKIEEEILYRIKKERLEKK